jgi:hypothetical protein
MKKEKFKNLKLESLKVLSKAEQAKVVGGYNYICNGDDLYYGYSSTRDLAMQTGVTGNCRQL